MTIMVAVGNGPTFGRSAAGTEGACPTGAACWAVHYDCEGAGDGVITSFCQRTDEYLLDRWKIIAIKIADLKLNLETFFAAKHSV